MDSKGIDVGIGTDGMSSDMIAQMRSAFLLARHASKNPTVGFMEIPKMLLENNPKILNKIVGWDIGEIVKGNSADIAIVDYNPATPLDESNFLGHLIFGMGSSPVDTTISAGKIIMQHKKIISVDAEKMYLEAQELARKVWERIDRS